MINWHESDKRRHSIRQEAECKLGKNILPLKNHDIFQFKTTEAACNFTKWAIGQKHIARVEVVQNRVAVKYKK